MTGDARVIVGENSSINTDSLIIGARNSVEKEAVDGANVRSGSVGGASVSTVLSSTTIGGQANPLGAYVDIQDGAVIEVGGNNETPGVLMIEATTVAQATDSVNVEALAGFALTVASSQISSNTESNIDIGSATLINRSGDVQIATQSDVGLRPSANLFAAAAGVAAGTAASADSDIDNTITIDGGTILGGQVKIQSGRNNFQVPNLISNFSNIESTTASFGPGINVGIPCLLYTSPSPRDLSTSRMPSSA